MDYLFLQKDFDCLKQEQEKLLKKHKKIGQALGEACGQSSETYHDNAPYDDALHNAKLNEERLDHLGEIIINAKIIELPKKLLKKTRIGNLLKVVDENEQEQLYEIGSYIPFENKKNNKNIKLISYTSPLGKCLMNKKVGGICVLKIKDSEKKLKILEIN